METFGERIRRLADEAKAALEAPGAAERIARLAVEMAEDEESKREAARRLFLTTSGIPERLWEDITHPVDTPAVKAVQECLDNRKLSCLMLAGKAGNGKSTAVCWGVWKGRGKFIHATDLVQASAFNAQFWTDLRETPVLAIDELGAEPANVQSQGMIFDLLNRRIENLKPTLLATNLDGPTFAAKYMAGPMERLKDRLANYGKWVEFTAPSMRRHYSEETA